MERILRILMCLLIVSQPFYNLRAGTNYPTSLDDNTSLYDVKNNQETNLDGAIDASVTTITVDSTAGFPSDGTIQIDGEVIFYALKTGTQFQSCTRGYDGTGATTHSDNAQVIHSYIADHTNVKRDAIIAIETKLGTGSSTPSANTVLRGDGAGSSSYGQIVSGDVTQYTLALDRIATSTAANINVYNASNVLASVAMSGEVNITSTGVTSLTTDYISETELDTEAELEAQITDMANIIQATEIDTFAELDALVADKSLLNTADNKAITADFDFGGGGIEIENNTAVPGSCTVGQVFLDTDASSGQQFYACEGGTFVLQGDGGISVALDLTDDDVNESSAILEIATTNDTNNIITEPSADKMLINMAFDWPKADDADEVTCTGCVADAELATDFISETELDTEAELEAQITDMANIIQATEIDTFSELNTLVADKTLINTADNATITADYDFSGGGIEVENGTTPPACTDGQIYVDTDASTGQRLMACESGVFVVQGDGTSSGGVATIQEGDVTVTNNANTLDFNGTDFNLTESPSGEVNISLAGSNAFTGCVVYDSGNQTISTSTNTLFDFDTEAKDTDNYCFQSDAALTGTVEKASADATITGTGTSFTTELTVNQVISIPGTATEYCNVKTITSNTSLECWANMANSASGQTATRESGSIGIPSGKAGWYVMTIRARMDGNATGVRDLFIRKNDSTNVDYERETANATAQYLGMTTLRILFAEGDIVQPTIWQNSGGNRTVEAEGTYSPAFSIEFTGTD